MAEVYVGVGSNIAPEKNIPAAVAKLAARFPLTGCSPFYRTRPLGVTGVPPFVNGMVRLTTALTPRGLKFRVLRRIERALGRRRGGDKNAPRTIDLDIALFGHRAIRTAGLTIPDPLLLKRDFLYVPLLKIDPRLMYPGTRRSVAALLGPRARRPLRLAPQVTRSVRKILSETPAFKRAGGAK